MSTGPRDATIAGAGELADDRAATAFVGRGWALDAIDDWLAGSEPAMLITGKPGSGKSALARRVLAISKGKLPDDGRARLREGVLLCAHFCRARDTSVLDPIRLVERIAAGLTRRVEGYLEALLELGADSVVLSGEASGGVVHPGGVLAGVHVGAVQVAEASAALAFERVVRGPLAALEQRIDSDIVVLVDALDESLSLDADETIARLLGDVLRAGSCPAWLRLLLLSRPDERVTEPLASARPLDLVRNAPADRDDVLMYAKGRLAGADDPDLAQRIADASKGNFLYARYAIDEALRAPGLSGALPPGLEGHYRAFLERELARHAERWEERFRPLLGLLAIARGHGLPREALIGAAGLPPSTVDDALRVLAQYLESADASVLRLYHESFREFLREDARFGVYPQEATEAIVRWYMARVAGGISWGDIPYACANLAAHAVEAGSLDSVVWQRGFLAHAEPFALRRALRAAGSTLARVYDAAFHHLPTGTPEERGLALEIGAARLADDALTERLGAARPPDARARVAWTATDAEVGVSWYRPSLSVSRVAVAELDGDLVLALVADREAGVQLWWPERTATGTLGQSEDELLPRRPLFVQLGRDPHLAIVGHVTEVVELATRKVAARGWSPGPATVVIEGGEPWLVEAHPVSGPIWVRRLGAGDLWTTVGRPGEGAR